MRKVTGTLTPTGRPCRSDVKSPAGVCGERRICGQDDAGETATVQPFPAEGALFDNLDLSKAALERRVADLPGKVRSYKMISVSRDETGALQQEGSGPNFQGGCLTLCTCQCVFRAEKRNPDEWLDDWWVAGFTSPLICGRTWLFYLAQVEHVYASQADLWKALPQTLRRAKSTRTNHLGDAYQPNPASGCSDPFDTAHYHPPMLGHSHHQTESDDGWVNDIEFFHAGFGRHPVLLVAKPALTFLWQTPLLFVDSHPRNKTWDNLHALLGRLRIGGQ
jgi:hypothetical protein